MTTRSSNAFLMMMTMRSSADEAVKV